MSFFFWDRIIDVDYCGIRIGFFFLKKFNLLDEVFSFLDRIIDVGYCGIRIGFFFFFFFKFYFFFQLTVGFILTSRVVFKT